MNICVFGDSLTETLYEEKGWVGILRKKLRRREEAYVFNLGIPGNTTRDLLERFDVEAKAREPDVIIFSIGMNDSRVKLGTDLNEFEENLEKLIRKARAFTNRICFIGLIPVDEDRTNPTIWGCRFLNDRIRKYDRKIKEICEKEGVKFVELFDYLDNEEWKKTCLMTDGLHPNSKGHRKIFEIVWEELRQWFEF